MTQENHCAENAMAERVNGILKQEYGLKRKWKTESQLKKAVQQAIWLYNEKRPHMSLDYQTPQEVHSAKQWEKPGALPPNPQDLSLKTEPMKQAQKRNPGGPKNRNDHRLRPTNAQVASQQSPTLPLAEDILQRKGNSLT